MSDKRLLAKLTIYLLAPLVLILAGVGLIVLSRMTGSLVMGLSGLILVVLGLLWWIVSAVVNGINPFDL
jgi:hypothetical protein